MRKYHYSALLMSASFLSMAGEHTVRFSGSVIERPCPIQTENHANKFIHTENHANKLIEDRCVPFKKPVYEAIYDTEDDGITAKHIGNIVHVTYL
ncbi:hypothetical protein [Vibrio sp. Hep-1b-8]|uniref:hypothetical protein n=1 Tax=Vibrio sp. Hep-1b-8 TaxID=2144187 RepID=UPI0011108BC0|nr:hypothetical protein [Vibrio sp. Hep-1b-8]TMX47466.1 hypothetical protein DA100_00745 [Vibrio sp. Hep-1b-8]